MATFLCDSELMYNHVAAVPIAAHSSFVTLLQPVNRRPAVLGLSNDATPKFNLIIETANGTRNITDLRTTLSLGTAQVQAFHAQQDSDLQVYLVFATRANATQSNIYVMKPFKLDKITADHYPLVLMDTVETFYVGPPAPGNPYPMILAAHKMMSGMINTSDLSRIYVSNTIAEVLPQFQLPQSPDSILDICAASHSSYGVGVWVLSSIQGKIVLMGEFASRDDETGRMEYETFSPACPMGATSIESFLQHDNNTGVVIGADGGLHLLDADTGVSFRAKASLVSTHSVFKAPQRLVVAQDGSNVTVWSVGQGGDLGYCTTTVAGISSLGNTYALIPAYGSASFSVAISRPSATAGLATISQTLISEDDAGNLTLLQQTRDTGLWREEPFYVDAPQEVFDIPSYTISIAALSASKVPVANGSVQVKASTTTTAIVNGRTYSLSSLGAWIPLDGQGELNLIVATSCLAGQALIMTGMKGSDGNVITLEKTEGIVVDPSRKAMSAFQNVNEDTDLTKLTTKTGKPLFANVNGDMPSSSDLAQAARCFSQFNTAMNDFHADGTPKKNNVPVAAAVANVKGAIGIQNVGDNLMDGFHWLKLKFNDAKNWFLEKVGQVWHFVCEIAGEIKRFVLDALEKISEAISWVWAKIKLGLQELIEFAGFIFAWDDIKECKNTIAGLINAAFDYGSSSLNTAETNVDGFFNDLKAKINQRETSGDRIGAASDSGSHGGNGTVDASRSTSVKWMGERLKNGGARNGTKLAMDNSITQPGEPTWESIFAPLGAATVQTVEDIGKDLSKVFHDINSLSNGGLWANFGKDLLGNVIDCVKTFVVGLLKLLDKLIINIKKLGNKEINIPVISALWEKMSGQKLTLIDAISLIIGLPTCLLIKIVTGRKPPTLPGLSSNFLSSLFNGQQPDTVKADFALYGSALTLMGSFFINLLDYFIIAYKVDVNGIPAGVDYLSPGAAMLVIKSLISVVTIVAAMPTDNALPASNLRRWTGYLAIASVGSKLLFTFTSIGGKESVKKLQAVDCLISLANFGLYEAVYAAELQPDAKFKDKDTMISACGIVENVFNTVVAVSRCTAVQTKDTEEEVALIALCVMLIAGGALVTNKSLTMSRVSDIKGSSSRGVLPVP